LAECSIEVPSLHGGAEIAGQENEGHRKAREWKLQENDGQHYKGWKIQDWKKTDKSADGKRCETTV